MLELSAIFSGCGAQQKIDRFLSRPSLQKFVTLAKQAAKDANGISLQNLTDQFPELARQAKIAGIDLQELVNTINSMAGTLNLPEVRRQLGSIMPSFGDFDEDEGVNHIFAQWIENLSDNQIKLLYGIYLDNDTSAWSFEDWVEALANAMREADGFESELSNLSNEYVTLSNAINGAKKAQDELNEALSLNNDEGYDTRVKAYQTISE